MSISCFGADSATHARWLIVGAAALYGSVTVGGRLLYQLGFSLYEISFYPLVLTCIVLVPWLVIRRDLVIKKEALPFFFGYGLIGALLQLSQFGGIVLGVPVAIVAFLLNMQPLWTVIIGCIFLGERVKIRKLLALALAICGMCCLVQGVGILRMNVYGIFLSVLGGILLSLWIVWGRRGGLQGQHYVTTIIGWSGFSSMWILLLRPLLNAVAGNGEMLRLSIALPFRHWLWLSLYTLIAGVLPSLMLFRGLQAVSASTAGVILLIEPVSASCVSRVVLQQPVGVYTILGGGIILISNFLILSQE